MLLDIGIYERDVDYIAAVIGDDFSDVFEMKQRLIVQIDKLIKHVGFISAYIIRNL